MNEEACVPCSHQRILRGPLYLEAVDIIIQAIALLIGVKLVIVLAIWRTFLVHLCI